MNKECLECSLDMLVSTLEEKNHTRFDLVQLNTVLFGWVFKYLNIIVIFY